MTLEEIRNLKFRIDYHVEALDDRGHVAAAVISDAFEVLLERNANQSLINTWLKTIGDEINTIIEALEEIEEELLN